MATCATGYPARSIRSFRSTGERRWIVPPEHAVADRRRTYSASSRAAHAARSSTPGRGGPDSAGGVGSDTSYAACRGRPLDSFVFLLLIGEKLRTGAGGSARAVNQRHFKQYTSSCLSSKEAKFVSGDLGDFDFGELGGVRFRTKPELGEPYFRPLSRARLKKESRDARELGEPWFRPAPATEVDLSFRARENRPNLGTRRSRKLGHSTTPEPIAADRQAADSDSRGRPRARAPPAARSRGSAAAPGPREGAALAAPVQREGAALAAPSPC